MHEIRIRMTLGAQRDEVLQSVLGEGVAIALVSAVFGVLRRRLCRRYLRRYQKVTRKLHRNSCQRPSAACDSWCSRDVCAGVAERTRRGWRLLYTTGLEPDRQRVT